MPNAFSNTIIGHMQGNIRTLYHRRKKVGRIHLTHEEYLQTFVPAEVRDAFWEARLHSYHACRSHRWTLHLSSDQKIEATLELHEPHATKAPPMVQMPQIQGDAPQEIVDRIHEWAARGGDASREFGRVMKVLEILNAGFSRVAIRYYWPTILAICSESTHTKDIVQELQDMRQPARLKPLPPGLSTACRLTAETISTARLIPADIEEEEGMESTIDIVVGQSYNEQFSAFWGLS
jgi:hypothetical protein